MQLIFKASPEHDDDLCQQLAAFLDTHKTEFETRLIPDLTHIDLMAHNVNGIEVLSVEHISDNQYRLRYRYDWQLFNGCAGKDESGIERDSVRFTLDENGVIDIAFLVTDERGTADEL